MARLHIKFRNIHRGARNAGEALFQSKPWSGTDEDKQTKFEAFLSAASSAYGVPTPTLSVIEGSDVNGLVAPNTIVIGRFSVTSLFNAFRLHLQYVGAVDVTFPNNNDAQAWGCSLFYTLRPIAFRKAVRAGTISGVRATDLLSSATLASRQEEVDEAFAGIVAGSYEEDEVEELEDESADGHDEEDEAQHTAGAYVNPSVQEDGTYSVSEAASILGVSQSTIRNMLRDGRLVGLQSERRVYVTGATLARIVPTSEVTR